jgi:energy-coupling factor transporter ATP-binding protein EcfA2
MSFIENQLVNLFNRATAPTKKPLTGGLLLGHIVGENGITQQPYYLPTVDRAKHIAILGKTGSGKSFLIRHLAQTDIRAGRGFLLFDLHGDLIPDLLKFAASLGIDPARIVLIDPTSKEWAIGLNPLEATDESDRFRQVTGVTRTFTERWNFTGARTEELFRNALLVLSENGLTLLEVAPLLTNDNYRAALLKKVTNADVREYFELRFNPLSDAMKATMREPVINKLTELTADPHFRFILGQRNSTISFDRIMQDGLIALVNLNKGTLGPHALTLGSLIYGKAKSAIFRRGKRDIFTIYADEIQNLVAADTDFEVLFSEARKFGVSIVAANQFHAQLPAPMRSAMQTIGTHIYFQLSPEDAEQVARDLSGGKGVAEKLKKLSARHFIAQQGNNRPYEVRMPEVLPAKASAFDLYAASNALYASRRVDIERDILARRPQTSVRKEALHDWE